MSPSFNSSRRSPTAPGIASVTVGLRWQKNGGVPMGVGIGAVPLSRAASPVRRAEGELGSALLDGLGRKPSRPARASPAPRPSPTVLPPPEFVPPEEMPAARSSGGASSSAGGFGVRMVVGFLGPVARSCKGAVRGLTDMSIAVALALPGRGMLRRPGGATPRPGRSVAIPTGVFGSLSPRSLAPARPAERIAASTPAETVRSGGGLGQGVRRASAALIAGVKRFRARFGIVSWHDRKERISHDVD